MVILRVAEGIRAHFPARASEWAFAVGLTAWAAILLYLVPGEVFQTQPLYAHMAATAKQATWGIGGMAVGGLRFLTLVINGTFADTAYGRISPHVRGLTALLSCFVWLQILIVLMGLGVALPQIGIYVAILSLDIYNTIRAFGDAGQVDRARRDAGS